jgi:hypothetical protein
VELPLSFFKTSNYKSHKDDPNRERDPKTCEWFLEHETFKSWTSGGCDGILWLSADPGCGKSVLSRALVDEKLLSKEDMTICYFFFKDNEEQNSLTTALCAMLHQLFCKHESLLQRHGSKVFKRCGEALKQDTDELWELFISAATDHSAGNVICILDALDECQPTDRKKLITRLESFHKVFSKRSRQGSQIGFLATSRPYTEIELNFSSLIQSFVTIHLAGENESERITREIGMVMETRLNSIAKDLGLDKETYSLLHSQLKNIPNRTYLWLDLVLDEVRNSFGQTGAKLQRVLDTIPQNLEEAYEKILSRCKGQNARRILHIVLAARRPLTLSEIDVALEVDGALERSCDPASSSLSLKRLDCEGVKRETTIRDACGLFISIVDSQVFLIHQTAKEFLLRKSGKLSEQGRWRNSIDIHDAHRILSMICVKYLLLPEIQDYLRPPYEKRGEYAFLEYSASHWTHHVQEAHDNDINWIRQILKLCDIGDGSSCSWYQLLLHRAKESDVGEHHTKPCFHQEGRELLQHLEGREEPEKERTILDQSDRTLYWPSKPQPKQIWAVVFGLVNVLKFLRGSKVDHDILTGSTANLLWQPTEDSGGDKYNLNRKKHGSTTPNLHADIEVSLDLHGLDISFEALEVISEQPTAREVMQIVMDCQRPEFLIDSMKAAASYGNNGIAVMQLLLQQQRASAVITEEIMKAAAEGMSVELMQLLVRQQGVDVLITEDVVKAAAMNLTSSQGREIFLLLLDQPGVSNMITDRFWETVSGLRYSHRVLKPLLGRNTTTEEMIATFVRISSLSKKLRAEVVRKEL